MITSSHIRSDIAADVTARRVAAAAVPGRRRRAPLAALAARLRPSAARRGRAAQPAA